MFNDSLSKVLISSWYFSWICKKRCEEKHIFSQNLLPSGGSLMVISHWCSPLATNVGHGLGLGYASRCQGGLAGPQVDEIYLKSSEWKFVTMRFVCLFVCLFVGTYLNIEQLFCVFCWIWCLQCALWVLFDRVVKKWYHLRRLHMTYNPATNESAGDCFSG